MIRELIKTRLTELGLSQRQLAIKIGCNYSVMNDYMTGKRNLPYQHLENVLIELDLLKK